MWNLILNRNSKSVMILSKKVNEAQDEHEKLNNKLPGENPMKLLYSVKVQFFCIAIGQKRITSRTAQRCVHSIALATRQPVNNKTFIDRSTTEWVNCACTSTAKFQSSFLVLLFLNLQISARFAIRSEQDIAELIKDKGSKSTKTSTKLATELLKQFCTVTGFFIKHSRRSNYLLLLSKFTPITGELSIL